jgi:hypothetical protein
VETRIAYKFVEEVRQQCRFTLLAFRCLKDGVTASNAEQLFLFAHSMVGHALQVARLLWPDREESRPRGEFLRNELKATEGALRRLTGLGARLAKSDEWFENWLGNLSDLSYLPMNVMPIGTMAGFKEDSFQRNLDPEVLELRLQGEAIELRKIADEARQLEIACERWLRTHNPW